MKQLSTVDNAFIALDSDRHPMHIGLLSIYESTDSRGNSIRFKDILATFRDRLPLTPILRRKLRRTPFGLDSPYWIDDKHFDLEYHVRHLALPKPGDFRQLSILTSRIWSRPLDLDRPPWEAFVIEGLDNIEGVPKGSYAMLFKMHHSACDGLSTNDVLYRLHDFSPETDNRAYYDNFEPEEEPTNIELVSRAYFNLLRSPVNFLKRYQELRQTKPDTEIRKLPDIQPTRFNKPVKANRVYLSEIFKVDDLKRIKNTVDGATINDVVAAIVSGALREYLMAKNELPESTMTAGIPMNTRKADEKMGGNQVNFMFVSLCSDIADPLERLRAIQQDIKENKDYRDAVRVRQQTDLINGLPSGILSAGLRVATLEALTSRTKAAFTTVLTNVPGPQKPLYFCGSKMLRTHGFGAPADNLGLFHTCTSYCGELAISPISCREMLPDPEFYGQCIRKSFDELFAATANAKTKTKKAPKKTTSKKSSAKLKAANADKPEAVSADLASTEKPDYKSAEKPAAIGE